MKTYPVLVNPRGTHFDEIVEAVETVNALQTYYRCELMREGRILPADKKKVPVANLTDAIQRKYRRKRVIAITEPSYDSELVLEEQLPWQILITCAEWNEEDAPSTLAFLLHSLASSLITF